MDDAAYLRAICWTPFDDGPRLVYADHLDERGDPRGEFIRVQCELARLPHYETCLETCAPPDFEGCPNRAQRRRELELLETHGERWVAALLAAAGVKPTGRQWVSAGGLCKPVGVGGRRTLGVEFCRGLVGSVTLTCRQFFGGSCGRCEGRGEVEGLAAALFRATPVTEVRLSDREPYQAEGAFWWSLAARPEMSSYLPNELLELLPDGKTGIFSSGNAAHAAVSAAAVALGRDRAELPALARPASANFF